MTLPKRSAVLGLGISVPDRVLTNHDLEKMVDTTDEWIFARTGMRERRILEEGQTVADIGAEAARRALDDAGMAPTDVDAIICCTYTPDHLTPSTACIVQDRLGIAAAPAFDMNAACAGFVYGLEVADALIRTGAYRCVLLIGLEGQSRHVDFRDRNTCILFGDGAGAFVLGPAAEGSDRGVLSTFLGADGSGANLIKIPAGGSAERITAEGISAGRHYIQMNGREVFKFAVRILSTAVDGALDRAGLCQDDIDLLVPHQANTRIIEAAAKRFNMPDAKVVCDVAKYGNTSAASIPLALVDARNDGRLVPGKVLALVAFGAGLTYGASMLRW